jgi:hypothetical protein
MTDADGEAFPGQPITYHDLEFDGDLLPTAIVQGDGVVLPVRRLCERLGLDARRELDRLRAHDVLVAGLREFRIPLEGRLRVVTGIQHRYLAFWLATVEPSQVQDEEMRQRLNRYQRELVDVLNALYGPDPGQDVPVSADPSVTALQTRVNDLLVELRLTREALLEIQQDTAPHSEQIAELYDLVDSLQLQVREYVPVTPAQREAIARAIRGLAARYQRTHGKELFGQLFAEFCRAMGTKKYDELPAHKYAEAMAWIQARARRLFPDDPDAVPPTQQSLL